MITIIAIIIAIILIAFVGSALLWLILLKRADTVWEGRDFGEIDLEDIEDFSSKLQEDYNKTK